MIRLTRLNGRPFVLNADQIKSIEETPDTMIALLNGEQVVVREALDEVVRRAIEYFRSLRAFAAPAPSMAPERQ
ncbi:MAG: flagellar FlbD family protein [Planctomycetota bacterium]